MGRVQEKWAHLFDHVEARSPLYEVRHAAGELREALGAPAIIESRLHTAHPEFRELLGEAREAIEQLSQVGGDADPESLFRQRGEISVRCQSCHEQFRRE
jgi:cytochrome c556